MPTHGWTSRARAAESALLSAKMNYYFNRAEGMVIGETSRRVAGQGHINERMVTTSCRGGRQKFLELE